jgi:hypothetical protein
MTVLSLRTLLMFSSVVVGVSALLTAPGLVDPLERAQDRLASLEQKSAEPGRIGFGVQLQWDEDDPASYEERVGRRPVLYGEFVEFPYRDEVSIWLGEKVNMVREAEATFMLTLEPHWGLQSVTREELASLTRDLTRWNESGVPVLVRFAHEMNGSWYPWGQQPVQYVQKFREVAHAVREAPASSIIWSPNEGSGYPFDGPFTAPPGTAEYAALDTDRDGTVTSEDDPYRPFYPGDDHVDWVGLSLYHFGTAYPWGENVIPPSNAFAQKLTGDYRNAAVDETYVPDFYEAYAERPGKPMAISETSALYNDGASGQSGASNEHIKSAWLKQIFAADVPDRFPQLRLINWFEQDKSEADVDDGPVRWALTRDPRMVEVFTRRVPDWLDFPKT